MNRIKCWSCGLVNFESVTVCRRCAQDLTNPPAPPVPHGAAQYPPLEGGYPPSPPSAPLNDAAPYGAPLAMPGPPYSPYPPPPPPAGWPPQNPYQDSHQGQYGPPNQGPYSGYYGSYQGSHQGRHPGSHGGGYAYGPMRDTRNQGQALAALIIGCLSLTVCPVASPIGLVLGIVALRNAISRPAEYRGKGMAITGICLNGVCTLFAGIMLVVFFLIGMASH